MTVGMCEKAPNISIGQKICDGCRKKLSKEVPIAAIAISSELDPVLPESGPSSPDFEDSQPPSPLLKEEIQLQELKSLQLVNQCLEEMGKTQEDWRSHFNDAATYDSW